MPSSKAPVLPRLAPRCFPVLCLLVVTGIPAIEAQVASLGSQDDVIPVLIETTATDEPNPAAMGEPNVGIGLGGTFTPVESADAGTANTGGQPAIGKGFGPVMMPVGQADTELSKPVSGEEAAIGPVMIAVGQSATDTPNHVTVEGSAIGPIFGPVMMPVGHVATDSPNRMSGEEPGIAPGFGTAIEPVGPSDTETPNTDSGDGHSIGAEFEPVIIAVGSAAEDAAGLLSGGDPSIGQGLGPLIAPVGQPVFDGPIPTTTTAGFDVLKCGLGDEFSCQGRCGETRKTPCSCHTDCFVYNTCCEDFSSVCPTPSSYRSPHHHSLLNLSTPCHPILKRHVISSCPPDANENLTSLCMTSRPDSLNDIIPMTDRMSGVHYKNAHCARCNGVTAMRPWSGKFGCIFTLSSVEHFFGLLVTSTVQSDLFRLCQLDWTSPGSDLHPECITERYVITPTECAADLDTQKSCEEGPRSLVYAYAPSVYLRNFYKNRHCLQCDADNFQFEECGVAETTPGIFVGGGTSSSAVAVTMDWQDETKEWLITAKDSVVNNPSSFLNASCFATAEGFPQDCKIMHCHPSLDLLNGSCILTTLPPFTVYANVKVPVRNWAGRYVSVMKVFDDVSKVMDNVTREMVEGANFTTETELRMEDNQWMLRFKQRVYVKPEKIGYQVVEAMMEGLRREAEENQLNRTELCATISQNHPEDDPPCPYYDVIVVEPPERSEPEPGLADELNANAAQEETTSTPTTTTSKPATTQTSWTWSKYACTLTATLSVVSLIVRLVLQPLLHRSCRLFSHLHCALCVALLVVAVLWLLGAVLLREVSREGVSLCMATSVGSHWFMLSAACWVVAACVESWRSSRLSTQRGVTAGSAMLVWHGFAWLLPAFFVIPLVAMRDFMPSDPLLPSYGEGLCFVGQGHSMLVFFVAPSCALTVAGVVFIGLTVRNLASLDIEHSPPILDVKTCVILVVMLAVTSLLALPAGILDGAVAQEVYAAVSLALGIFASGATTMGRSVFRSNKENENGDRSWPGHKTSKRGRKSLAGVVDLATAEGALVSANQDKKKEATEEINKTSLGGQD